MAHTHRELMETLAEKVDLLRKLYRKLRQQEPGSRDRRDTLVEIGLANSLIRITVLLLLKAESEIPVESPPAVVPDLIDLIGDDYGEGFEDEDDGERSPHYP